MGVSTSTQVGLSPSLLVTNLHLSTNPEIPVNIDLVHGAILDLKLIKINLNPPVGGRLKFFLENWKLLTHDLEVVGGLRIPFLQQPVQDSIPTKTLETGNQALLIDAEVESMLEKKAIPLAEPCTDQFLSPVFLVPKKDGGTDRS